MDKLSTWVAIAAVGIGFIILVWLLLAEQPPKEKEDKKK